MQLKEYHGEKLEFYIEKKLWLEKVYKG